MPTNRASAVRHGETLHTRTGRNCENHIHLELSPHGLVSQRKQTRKRNYHTRRANCPGIFIIQCPATRLQQKRLNFPSDAIATEQNGERGNVA
ncbi:hypothetical protein Trydic_g21577 [Trypoxylus dichotomus]